MSLGSSRQVEDMNDFEKMRCLRKENQTRIDAARKKYEEFFIRLQDFGSKEEVVEYLAELLGEEPIERDNDVLFGETLVRFDNHGRFLNLSDGSHSPVVALGKHRLDNVEVGDT